MVSRLLSGRKFVSLLMQLKGTNMHMSGESLLIILVVGLVAGWLSGQLVQGTGFGIVGDLLIGIAGALIGSWLLPQLGLYLGSGIISAIINATIGAVLLLLVIRTRSWPRWVAQELGRKLGKTLVAGGVSAKCRRLFVGQLFSDGRLFGGLRPFLDGRLGAVALSRALPARPSLCPP